jgi:hypothetical protein
MDKSLPTQSQEMNYLTTGKHSLAGQTRKSKKATYNYRRLSIPLVFNLTLTNISMLGFAQKYFQIPLVDVSHVFYLKT